MRQGQFLSGGLNSEFSFSYTGCLNKAKEPKLPYYLPITSVRFNDYTRFPSTQ